MEFQEGVGKKEEEEEKKGEFLWQDIFPLKMKCHDRIYLIKEKNLPSTFSLPWAVWPD